MTKIRFIIISALMISALFSEAAFGGIHRHDVADSEFIALASKPEFDCVGQLKSGEKSVGSAVMIAPRWAITSAHIFGESTRNMTLTVGGQTLNVTKVVIHPDFKNADAKLKTDLALIMLGGDYTGKTAKIYEQDQELGKLVTIVGYGAFRGAFDTEGKSGEKRAGQNVIDAIGGADIPNNFMMADLTRPSSDAADKADNKTPVALEYIIDGGDSGGGMFIQNGNEWVLAGINTRTSHIMERLMKFADFGFYGSKSYYTRLSTNKSWIETTTKA